MHQPESTNECAANNPKPLHRRVAKSTVRIQHRGAITTFWMASLFLNATHTYTQVLWEMHSSPTASLDLTVTFLSLVQIGQS